MALFLFPSSFLLYLKSRGQDFSENVLTLNNQYTVRTSHASLVKICVKFRERDARGTLRDPAGPVTAFRGLSWGKNRGVKGL